MKLKDFAYHLPEELIAQYPLTRRDHARLMVINRDKKTIEHDIFANLGEYLPAQSHIVLNDSKVIPARLFGRRETGGRVEIFLLKDLGGTYEVLMRPLRRLKEGEHIKIDGGGLVAEIVDREHCIVRFNRSNVLNYLKKVGHIPLPPYIIRKDKVIDRKYYQTVFASKDGSVASPTAGLHFTNSLLNKFQKQGRRIDKVTLHINYGTFKLVEENDITRHQMHSEDYQITKKTLKDINNSREEGREIVAVGTTSCRVLETVARNNVLKGSTNIFMYPGYQFRMTNILVTNFHLPYSTLLMLVYAFGGKALMKKAYQEAIRHKYRFYSYGDGMVII